ncbi:MAG: hypothetical protein AAFO91_07365 [Bacteroidota bacterium]
METITLKVPNKKSRNFLLQVLAHFDFVTIIEDEPTDAEVLSGIKQGLQEAELIENGKLPSRSAQDFLNELKRSKAPV